MLFLVEGISVLHVSLCACVREMPVSIAHTCARQILSRFQTAFFFFCAREEILGWVVVVSCTSRRFLVYSAFVISGKCVSFLFSLLDCESLLFTVGLVNKRIVISPSFPRRECRDTSLI